MKAEEAVVVISAVYGQADVKHDLIYLKFLVDPFLTPRCLSTPWIIPSTTLGTPTLTTTPSLRWLKLENLNDNDLAETA